MKDAHTQVLTRLLETARLIRRRGTPDEAAAVIPYEQLLERDLEAYQKSHSQAKPADLAHAA